MRVKGSRNIESGVIASNNQRHQRIAGRCLRALLGVLDGQKAALAAARTALAGRQRHRRMATAVKRRLSKRHQSMTDGGQAAWRRARIRKLGCIENVWLSCNAGYHVIGEENIFSRRKKAYLAQVRRAAKTGR
jgi:hypothetical protein